MRGRQMGGAAALPVLTPGLAGDTNCFLATVWQGRSNCRRATPGFAGWAMFKLGGGKPVQAMGARSVPTCASDPLD